MHNIELIIALLAVVTILAEVADRLRLPYPVLLVLVGMGLGLAPGLPRVALAPDLVFLIFLPPLLYSAAWGTSWPDFKAARRPIGLLALGCVLFTTCLVAVVAHALIPGFSWPVAFLLGAIISPPDAVAATSATKGLGLPRRVVTILEGESLVNDASGLIAYRYALVAVLTGNFVLWQAGLQMVWAAAAGAAIGLAVGWLVFRVHLLTRNAIVDTSLTFLTPYLAYLTAEEIHVSGVLAVVAAGLFLTRRSALIFEHQSRLQTYAVWNTIVLLLNGLVFILIGLELPVILADTDRQSLWMALGYSLVISLTVIIGRLLWVYPGTYLPRWLSGSIREREPAPALPLVTVIAWTGMRGVVSLAAALALPLTLSPGVPFPHRNLILFITFVVIFCTLVGQALSLAPLIRWLGIAPDNSLEHEEVEVRMLLATQTAAYLASPDGSRQAPADVLARMRTRYEIRLERLRNRASGVRASLLDEKPISQFQQLQETVIRFERRVLEQLRHEEKTSEEVLRKIENELDLEESRLASDKA
ncbi:Na+/H+ antiporter [Hymenobacter sp. BT186]|uniref:Na+/H+ antiporter n=1 Tax=Hymenobacter telluris TaxID=2816474 RepID=A0A939EXY0_9BACT|nr:Na+/H+ antiporter [Hymenobacter telluris]MBO0359478.1 Na+/H+ antiporter [Hymenobacter telluris]MBW3375504.1 Na+/H+ antiporter [Hymenobacter norwichensis]